MSSRVARLSISMVLMFCVGWVWGQNEHSRLLYQNSLQSDGQDQFAHIINHNGTFVPNGWQSTQTGVQDGSKLIVAFNDRLPATGTIEWTLSNFDPYLQTHTSKQHFAFLTSREGGTADVLYEDGSWVYWRTGTNYRRDNHICSIKMDVGSKGLDTRTERHVLWNMVWNKNAKYRFKLVYNQAYASVYLDDQLVKTFEFPGQVRRFRYLYLGGDFTYASIAGPIYSDLKVYTTQTDMFFMDKTYTAGLQGLGGPEYAGHGITIGDVNGDDLEDVYIGNCMQNACRRDILYIQQPDGTYQDETLKRGVEDECCSHGVIFFDADNDGDLDLFNANTWEPNQLYINDGQGYFTEESVSRGVEQVDPQDETRTAGTRGAVVFDANNDGWMDIFAVNWGERNEMYINDGSGTFRREFRGAEGDVEDPEQVGTQGVTVSDIDGDGDFDIYISKRQKANELYINRDGMFTEEASSRGVAVTGRSDGATFADYDNDGDMDLFVANTRIPKGETETLYAYIFENRGDGTFIDRTLDQNIALEGFTPVLADVNNDGVLDFYRLRNNTYHSTAMAILNLGTDNGEFVSAGYCGADVIGADARACVAHDFDDDGDLDYYITTKKFDNILLSNETPLTTHFIKVHITGPRGDRGGIGSKLWVYEAGHLGDIRYLLGYREVTTAYGYLSGPGLTQHVGLGHLTECDIRVRLVDGSVLEKTGVQADQLIALGNDNQQQGTLTIVSGQGQTGEWGETLATPLRVKLSDAEGTPMVGQQVAWTLISGNGASLSSTQTETDVQGHAVTQLTLGQESGDIVVEAKALAVDTDPVQFVATATEPEITLYALGNNQAARVTEYLADSVGVRLTTRSGQPVTGMTIRFETGVQQGLISGDTLITKITDQQGQAQVDWQMPQHAGPVHLQATWRDTTLILNAQALPSSPTTLVRETPVPQALTPGEPFPDPFRVRVTDSFGNAVAQQAVHFFVRSGGGHLQGQQERQRLTDQSGTASVTWTAGPYRGPAQTLLARATLADGKTDSVRWTVPESPINTSYSHISAPDTLVANGTDQAVIVVSLIQPDGSAAGAGFGVKLVASGSQNTLIQSDTLTDEGGQVSAVLSTLQAETKSIQAEILGMDKTLGPILIHGIEPDPVASLTLFRILSGNKQNAEAGTALPEPFVLECLNKENNPLPDQIVRFEVIMGQAFFAGQSVMLDTTDSRGRVSQTLTLGSQAVDSCVVTVTPLSAPKLAEQLVCYVTRKPARLRVLSGKDQQGQAGSRLRSPLIIEIQDQQNLPIANEPVLFEVIAGGGHFSGQTQVTRYTSKTGQISQTLFLGTTAGDTCRTRLTPLNARSLATTISAVITPADADTLIRAGGNNQFGQSGSTLPLPLQVKVQDRFSNAIPEYPVEFLVTDGDAQVSDRSSTVVLTDDSGSAAVAVTLGAAKTSIIQARTLVGTVHFTASVASTERLIDTHKSRLLIADSTAFPNGKDPIVITAEIIDTAGQPYPGRTVWFDVAGEGVTITQPSSLTDKQGRCSGFVLATEEGYKTITAWVGPDSVDLEHQPTVQFTYGNMQLIKSSGDNQVGTPGRTLASPLVVRVLSDARPVFDYPVHFKVIQGEGTLNGAQQRTVKSDQQGYAGTTLDLGLEADSIRVQVHAERASNVLEFNARTQQSNNLHLIKCAGDSQTVYPGDPPADLAVVVRDASGQSRTDTDIWFEAINGGTVLTPQPVQTNSEGRAHSSIKVPATSGLYYFTAQYKLQPPQVFMVQVKKRNRPPEIQTFSPSETWLSVPNGRQLHFHVNAQDADQDSIYYSWTLDNLLLSYKPSLSLLVNASMPDTFTITAQVSDHQESTRVSWTIERLYTDVTLGEFSARYVQDAGVRLNWTVAGPSTTYGLYLYRQDLQSGEEPSLVFTSPPSSTPSRSYWDKSVSPGKRYRYQIHLTSATGDIVASGDISLFVAMPNRLALKPCYPNPFNSTLRIEYELPSATTVDVSVYNSTGQLVRQLYKGYRAAGSHHLQWQGLDRHSHPVPSGIYHISLNTPNDRKVQKVILMK